MRRIVKIIAATGSLLLLPAFALAYPGCKQQIVIKNPSGDLKLGAIHEPPRGSDYSVWFPVVPRALAFDSQDNIYVGDSVKYRILKYDKRGNFLLKIPLQKPVHTKKPELNHEIRSIAIDKNGNIYALNILEYRVEIYTPAGKFVKHIDYFKDEIDALNSKKPRNKFQPVKVSVDIDGNVYLVGGKDRNSRPVSGAMYGPDGTLKIRGVAPGVNYNEAKVVGATDYSVDVEVYAPDPKLPGKTYTAIKIKDKNKYVVKHCSGIDNLAEDESGPALYLDRSGHLYGFDTNENVIKINAEQ